ncbi:MAG: monomeric [FeFe] hydrogenase [Spirochaetales bacterium]|uniref:Monomeric [FeFe] hydrogenase n=1 Tax=Candidatus Thalassospirochaeta sargassi TaxID=3119039 RepID=A0AAJ1IEJ5_9SPIO|nr:monomeric [FeFe] hydrogenase [Spirochaetales bacterium]
MLTMNNQSNYIRKELSSLLLKDFNEDKLARTIDRIPIDLNPRDKSSYRCCTFKDRAMTRYRIMALLGFSIEQDDDEYKPLKEYLGEALVREKIEHPPLTVISVACSSCPRVTYRVTDSCRGCLARPCETNCPFGAISIKNGRAEIDKDKCRNCGKCRELCPFNAIIYTPVPCEDACPVNAVKRDDSGNMFIDYDNCISCGRCVRSCPFGAVMERSQLIDVSARIKEKKPITAMLAPSIIGQFPGSTAQLVAALKQLGFTAVVDVAAGADETSALEAVEFAERIEQGEAMMATSCCPAWVDAAEKHISGMKIFLSDTGTPLFYTSQAAETLFPGSLKVFIGPCTAKRSEAIRDNSADYVLSFEELGAMLIAAGIDVNDCEETDFNGGDGSFRARAFAASGGVADAVIARFDEETRSICNPLKVDGLTKKNINLLKAAAAGKLKYNLIEVMSCEGGCICGPGVIGNPKVVKKKLENSMSA